MFIACVECTGTAQLCLYTVLHPQQLDAANSTVALLMQKPLLTGLAMPKQHTRQWVCQNSLRSVKAASLQGLACTIHRWWLCLGA